MTANEPMGDSEFLALLDSRGCRFTIIPPKGTPRSGDEKPYTGKAPQGKGWQNVGGSNYPLDDPTLAAARAKGWGRGLVCGSGDVIAFDADGLERLEELGVVAKLPATIEVESRPDHRHRYYICPELKHKFVFYDPVKIERDENGEPKLNKRGERKRLHLGEVLGPAGHVVLPGTPHPIAGTTYHGVPGGPYEITKLTIDELRDICDGLAFSVSTTKTKSFDRAARLITRDPMRDLEDIEAKARKGKRGGSLPSLSDQIGDIRRVIDAYGWEPARVEGDEWKGPAPCHASESGDCFQVNIKSGLWHCKQCDEGGDAAALVAIFEKLINCDGAEDLARDSTLFDKVLAAAKTKGLVDKKSGPTIRAKPKQSVATRLVNIVLKSGAELWHSPDDEPFISIPINGHREHHPTKNKPVRRWLSQLLHAAEGRTPQSQAIRDALTVLEGRAVFDGAEYPVSVRLAAHGDYSFRDMGND